MGVKSGCLKVRLLILYAPGKSFLPNAPLPRMFIYYTFAFNHYPCTYVHMYVGISHSILPLANFVNVNIIHSIKLNEQKICNEKLKMERVICLKLNKLK